MKKEFQRRKFLKGISALSLLSLAGIGINKFLTDEPFLKLDITSMNKYGNSDQTLRLGLIGFGVRGEQLLHSFGFITPKWRDEMIEAFKADKTYKPYEDFLNQPSLNVEFTGICDVFDKRAEAGLSALGKTAKRFKNYKELIQSNDIDAVIIATPDHLHATMTLEAAKAGKHVYLEKCFARTIEETFEVYKAVKNNGIVFQLGHQLRQAESYHAAKDAIDKKLLGKISLIQTNTNRNSPNGAWVYDIDPEANAKSVDWKQFDIYNLGTQFNADKFFRWRKYWDYGNGLFGDLMTHDFDAVNHILAMGIPEKVTASGGNYYWKDEREVPDVLNVCMEYPSQGFSYLYSATQSNERLRSNLVMGDEATMEIGAQMYVYPDPNSKKYKRKLNQGIMNPDTPFYSSEQPEELDAISSATTKYFANKGMLYTYRNGKRLNPTYLHLEEWLNAIRYGGTTSCNIECAFEEAVTTHMAVKAYKEKRQVYWDSLNKKIV